MQRHKCFAFTFLICDSPQMVFLHFSHSQYPLNEIGRESRSLFLYLLPSSLSSSHNTAGPVLRVAERYSQRSVSKKKKKKGKEKKQKKIGNALHVRCDESEATQQPMLSLECVREQWPSYCDCIDVREFLEVAYATGCGRPEKRGEFSKPSYAPVLSVCSINRLH